MDRLIDAAYGNPFIFVAVFGIIILLTAIYYKVKGEEI